MSYSFYEPYSFAVRRSLKRVFREKGVKKQAWPYQKLYLDVQTETSTQSLNTAAYTMALEHAWLENNPLCLIPESASLVEQILHSNFEGQLDNLAAEYELFAIAIPKSSRFNTHHVQGLFVSISNAIQRESYIAGFKQDFDIVSPIYSPQDRGKLITINYKVGNDLVLDTFSAEIGRIPEVLALLKQTNKTRFEVLRFVLGFIIYMSAFDDVVEDARYLNIPSIGYKQKIRQSKVREPSDTHGTGRQVRFHFRNLRHECFYRGEYEDLTPGSRWIPVKGAVKLVRRAA